MWLHFLCPVSDNYAGSRLGRPSNCSEDCFSVMLQCWSVVPSERPTFSLLYDELQKLLHLSHGHGSMYGLDNHQYDSEDDYDEDD